MMRKTLVAALLLSGASVVGVSAGSTIADSVPRHDHFLRINDKEVQVGPRVCANSNLHTAFHNFHSHVHTGEPTGTGGLTIMRSAFCEP